MSFFSFQGYLQGSSIGVAIVRRAEEANFNIWSYRHSSLAALAAVDAGTYNHSTANVWGASDVIEDMKRQGARVQMGMKFPWEYFLLLCNHWVTFAHTSTSFSFFLFSLFSFLFLIGDGGDI